MMLGRNVLAVWHVLAMVLYVVVYVLVVVEVVGPSGIPLAAVHTSLFPSPFVQCGSFDVVVGNLGEKTSALTGFRLTLCE